MSAKTIFKRTSSGKIQTWKQEIHPDGTKYRTVSGQLKGKQVTSEWTQCEGKNIGKANETSATEQCGLEVESNYTKKLAQGKYHETADQIDNAKFFAPMLAKDWHDYQLVDGYSQPKLDGMRCILKADGMWSRNGKPIPTCPHIVEAFEPLFKKYPDFISDGELYGDKLSDDFQELLSIARQQKPTEEDFAKAKEFLTLHIYDFPSMPGDFIERWQSGLSFVQDEFNSTQKSVIQLVATTRIKNKDHMDSLYGMYMESGYEGQMIRTNDGHYKSGRQKQLLKRKEFLDKEFKIKEVIEGQGNWTGMAKSVLIELEDGSEQNTGMRGSRKFAKRLLEEKKKFIGGDTTVRYQRRSNDGKLIFPVAIAFYEGKRDT